METIVEKYLKLLLYDYDCVVIPNFGGFISTYMGSEISIAKNKIAPARKQIKFNDKIVSNDGLLIDFIAESEKISILDAYKLIEYYIEEIKAQILLNSQYTIDSLGRLYVNDDGAIFFEQYLKFNYLKESYGLPDLYFKPIDRNIQSKTLNKPKKQRLMASNINDELEDDDNLKQYASAHNDEEIDEYDEEDIESQQVQKKTENLAVYYILAIMALVLTAGTAYYINMDKTTYAIGSFNPFNLFGNNSVTDSSNVDNKLLPNESDENIADQEVENTNSNEAATNEYAYHTANDEPVKNINNATTVDNTIDAESIISGRTGRYYIIAGGFKSKKKASVFYNSLISEGNSAKLIDSFDETGIYRVTIADFSTYEEAQQQRKPLADKYGEELWVLNY